MFKGLIQEDTLAVERLLKKNKSLKLPQGILLAIAIGLLFIGTVSGYASLQLSDTKLTHAQATAVEMSKLSLDTGYCTDGGSSDPRCMKAKQIVEDPDQALVSSQPSEPVEQPVPTEKVSVDSARYFENDPLAQAMMLMMVPASILKVYNISILAS